MSESMYKEENNNISYIEHVKKNPEPLPLSSSEFEFTVLTML